MIDYMASCNGTCRGVDAEKLKFVKIAERGWIDASREEGYWASDVLLEDGSSWNVSVPEGLRSGEYVLRTEIIVRTLALILNPVAKTAGFMLIWRIRRYIKLISREETARIRESAQSFILRVST